MDLTILTELISNLGFPMVVAGACMLYVYRKDTENKSEIQRITDEHKEEVNHLTTAIDNNTEAIRALVVALQKEGV